MSPRPSFACIAALLSFAGSGASALTVGDRASHKEEVARDGFDATEERYLAAAAAGDSARAIDLARFYMSSGLWVEALVALRHQSLDGNRTAHLFAAECEYNLGRYRRVIALLEADAETHPLLAMALARLGAYADAREAFARAHPLAASDDLRRDYYLTKAETLVETGAPKEALAALSGAAPSERASKNRRDFILSRIYEAEGERLRASAAMRRAAVGDRGEWTMRAKLALAIDAEDVGAVQALSLEWQGGAFERELQHALGRLRLAGDDYDRGFAALNLVVDRNPESDAAATAAEEIAAALPELFAAGTAPDPKNAARLFFENVEFAPPGAEGDRLIQEAANRLRALGLYRQAAALLDHQVFKRLRGVERSTVAADLAELLLLARDPSEALRVIRATRIAGLSDEVDARRRRLEVKALAEGGRADAALALLSDASSASELHMRADINWTRRDFAGAASDYASYLASLPRIAGASDRRAAVRAATAFLLAGDRAGYRAFSLEAIARLEGTPEADLIRSLGNVDREEFLETFMRSYRSVYSDKAS